MAAHPLRGLVVVGMLLAAAVLVTLPTAAAGQQYDSDRDDDAPASGFSDALIVNADVTSGAIVDASADRRSVTVDTNVAVAGIEFDEEQCLALPSPVLFSSTDSQSEFIRRRGFLVPFPAIRCVNTTRMVISIDADPFFEVRPGGEVIELTFLAAVFKDGRTIGYPYDPTQFRFWFRVQQSDFQIRTGINDAVLSLAYGVSTVSSLTAAMVLNHPMLATVMPRCDFLFAISQCSFATMFDVDPVQYPLQIPFGDTDADVWAQFKAVGTMNFVFVVGVLVLAFGFQLAKRMREELREIDAAVERRRAKALEVKKARRAAAEKRAHELAVAATRLTEEGLRKLDAELKANELLEIEHRVEDRRRARRKEKQLQRARQVAPVQERGEPSVAPAVTPTDPAEAAALSKLREKRMRKHPARRRRKRDEPAYSDGQGDSAGDADDSSNDSVTALLVGNADLQHAVREQAQATRPDDGVPTSSGDDPSSSDADDEAKARRKHRRKHRETATSIKISKGKLHESHRSSKKKKKHRTAKQAPKGKSVTVSAGGGAKTNARREKLRKGPAWFIRLRIAWERVLRRGLTQPGHRFAGGTAVLTLLFLLFKSSFSSSAVVLWNVPEPGIRAAMAIVLLVWFFAPFAATIWLVAYAYPRRCDVVWADESARLLSNYDAFVGGEGHWEVVPVPTYRRRNAQRIAILLPMFERYRPGRQWFVLFELMWSALYGLLEATRTDRGCEFIAGPAALLGLSNFVLVVALRPHTAAVDRAFYTMLGLVYTVAPMAQVIFFVRPTLTLANIFAAFLIVFGLFTTIAQLVVALVQLHDFVQFRFLHSIPWWFFARFQKWTLGRGFYSSVREQELAAEEEMRKRQDAQLEEAKRRREGKSDAHTAPDGGDGSAATETPDKTKKAVVLREDGLMGLAAAEAPSTAEALGRRNPLLDSLPSESPATDRGKQPGEPLSPAAIAEL